MSETVTIRRTPFAAAQRFVHDFSWRMLGCEPAYAASLLVAQLWLGLLWFFYQGFGIARGLILCSLLAGLIVLRFFPRKGSSPRPVAATTLPPILITLLALAVATDVGMMAVSSARSFKTLKIPMDEGETSWRAGQLLWQGKNPYGPRALVDLNAYRSRAPQRRAAGFHGDLSDAGGAAALGHYRVTLDSGIRDKLLPIQASPRAALEARLYGYKYGPLILLATAAVAPFSSPGAVMILNGLTCFAMFAVLWRILRHISGPQLALAGAAMLALLLDRHITRNYIDRSATDVWALLFGALAVLASLSRRPMTAALATAFAVGCKTLPGLLFLPLLFRGRSATPVLVFLLAVTAIYLPWLLWDPPGLLFNAILWPLYMANDATSWQFYAPNGMALAARVAAVIALVVLWLQYIFGKETRLFWTLAVSATLVLVASGFLRNGYIPWVSLWMVAAIAEAFSARSCAQPALAIASRFRAFPFFNRRTAAAG